LNARPGRPAAEPGIARTIAPAALRNDAGKVTAWRAQFRDGQNRKRQLGVYRTQSAARRATEEHVADLNADRTPVESMTLGEWMDAWPSRVGRDPRTVATHRARIETYIYPHLAGGKDRLLTQITRTHLHDIQGRCSNVASRRRRSTAPSAASRRSWDTPCGSTASKPTPHSLHASTRPTRD